MEKRARRPQFNRLPALARDAAGVPALAGLSSLDVHAEALRQYPPGPEPDQLAFQLGTAHLVSGRAEMRLVGWNRLRQEPYRLLFPLGITFGCSGVTHWLLYALGLSDASPFYHASIQLGAYVYCFIAGFLWTALPRMTGAAPASVTELALLLSLLAAQMVLLNLHRELLAQAAFAGLLVLLVVFAGRRMAARRGPAPGPTELIWIPVGVGFGLAGSALLTAGLHGMVPAWAGVAGRVMAQQGFSLSVVMGVAGFMAPRLMGRAGSIAPAALSSGPVDRVRRARMSAHLLAACLLGASFFAEGIGSLRAAYGLRALLVTAEFGWCAQFWKPPAVKDGYVRLLWLSLWFVILGLWAAACWPKHRSAMLHLVFIGGFSLMIFAVGTMVVLSHAGQAGVLRKRLWILQVVAVGVPAAAAARVLANLQPAHYRVLLAAAASAWLAVGVSWLLFVLPWVVRAAPEGAFERVHEQAKRRLRRAV